MPVGAIIGGVASIGGALLSNSSNNRATTAAANAQTNVAAQNNALAASIYNQNRETLSPFVQGGTQAQTQINALLGLNGQPAQTQGFDTFRNSTGYQFQRDEGLNALDASAAARGALRSGAAMQSAQRYGTNLADQYFGNYMGYLANQQGVGLGAASAQAGVGNNYVSNVTANNQNAANATSNAALMRANNNNMMYGSIANSLGRLGSSFLG